MKKILITKYKNFILTCLSNEDSFYEMNLTNPEDSILGNVYVGRIEKKAKSIHAFFISYGPNKTAFLSEEDCKNPIILSTPSKKKLLVEGSLILIQISKEAIKTKDPTATTNITLQGKYSIVDCNENTLRFSSKLSKRKRIQIKSTNVLSLNPKYGVILRTQIAYLGKEDYSLINDELILLYNKMDTLLANVNSLKAHTLVYSPEEKYLLKIRDLNLNEFERITTDDPVIFDQLSSYFSINCPTFLHILTYYKDATYSLHKLHRINKNIQDIQNKTVYLKNGATLLIEQTEAMNVIDVNSGKAIKGNAKEETFYNVNLIAAKEIAKQIRLRNLSGIIIIDFINMMDKDNINNLIVFLSNLLKEDPIKTQFVDITKLGLIELTRKRISPSIKEQLFTEN